MANELTTAKTTEIAQVNSAASLGEIFTSMIELAKDPNVDPAKMASLVEVQKTMMETVQKQEFNRSKYAAISEMPTIGRSGEIKNKHGSVQSRYSKFEDIMKVIKPILSRHSLTVSFNIGSVGNKITVQPVLAHINGYVEYGGNMPVDIDTSGSKNSTQGAGSAVSYGKRHSLKAMLNIVDAGADDDGQSAGYGNSDNAGCDPLYEAAGNAASCGMAAYERWFKSDISKQDRFAMTQNGWHDQFKAKAEKADAEREAE